MLKALRPSSPKEGPHPFQIGVVLRDSFVVPKFPPHPPRCRYLFFHVVFASGIALVVRCCALDGRRLIRVVVPPVQALPLSYLRDLSTDSNFCLILIEARIHRLARYYESSATLPTWKYQSQTAWLIRHASRQLFLPPCQTSWTTRRISVLSSV